MAKPIPPCSPIRKKGFEPLEAPFELTRYPLVDTWCILTAEIVHLFLLQMTATCYLAASKTFHAAFLDRSSPSAARVPLVGR